ncbi:MAG: hypothetical protein ABIJ09_24900 [Pseudomonadota bacterium]
MTRALRPMLALTLFMCGALWTGAAHAEERYGMEIRVISAQPGTATIDPALKSYQRDLQAMPYKSFKLLDAHSKTLRKGETVSMQFPGESNRFMKVKANGQKDGKLSFSIAIDELRFRTSVRIPDNGTLIVGGPKYENGVILLAVTARTAP